MKVITISRSYGSAGTLFAKRLADVLGYRYADEAHIANIGKTEGIRDALALNGEEDENEPSFFEKVAELADNRSFFKVALETFIYDLALKGNLVFVGGGAHIILRGYPGLFSIQIVRNLEDRINAIATEKHISFEEASELIKKRDRHKANFISHYFDMDLFDHSMFHLTINASLVNIDDAVELVTNQVKKIVVSADDVAFLRKRLLERRAQLLLFSLDVTHKARIIFEVQDEGILIAKGVISNKNKKEQVLAALSRLPEVKEVEDRIKVEVLSRIIY
ncbi:MAG TPA: cytidylate kinase-like family protein [Syntrophorhabdaceae bacterium]|nr:cytidylate kinase-like family protein [Syntrophorhabdaceae bacterium]HOG39975.1 cytidylate kinase-like family protein [Syntrophorhabdaceae bacterium]